MYLSALSEYEDLEDHFRSDHYLCEEDQCLNEKFVAAFRSEIDLKAHKAKRHASKMTKIQAKQTRQVDVEINLPARQREYQRGPRDGKFNDIPFHKNQITIQICVLMLQWKVDRVVKCDIIKNQFLEFLNFVFIFRKSIKNNVQMLKTN